MGCRAEDIPEQQPEACPLLPSVPVIPFGGNWEWVRTRVSFGGTRTPQSEGYTRCWVIDRDSVAVCQDGLLKFKLPNQIHLDEHPFAGQAGYPDSAYLFYATTGIMTMRGDTLEIFDSYVDGDDYWLVRK